MNTFAFLAPVDTESTTMVVVSIFVIIMSVVGAIISFIRKGKDKENHSDAYKNETTKKKVQKKQEERREYVPIKPRVIGADGHSHEGELEEYDKIVGSLGAVSSEGCAELDGVRLILNDDAYDPSMPRIFDRNKVAQAIVLGEVLGEPRFKHPFGRK